MKMMMTGFINRDTFESMQIQVFYLDAFTTKLFSGNPAAVCPLNSWITSELMQAIAAENNLAETAFLVPNGRDFDLKWFTPTAEVELCGHATLASAYVLFEHFGYKEDRIRFHTKSGDLYVSRDGKKLTLDFPGRIVERCEPTEELLSCFEKTPREVLHSGARTYIVVLDNEREIRSYQPDFAKLSRVDRCVNITAPGDACDFVSRFFGPNIGLPEDPVTGSAHCGLAIYWSRRLKRDDELKALQLSKREGEIFCQVVSDRVLLSGSVVPYMEGKTALPGGSVCGRN